MRAEKRKIERNNKIKAAAKRNVGQQKGKRDIPKAVDAALNEFGLQGKERTELFYEICGELGHNGGKETAARRNQFELQF